MMFFQCSKCKMLKTVDETVHNTPEKINVEIKHCHRRMRQLTQTEYDHETEQRDWVENGGGIPTDTQHMRDLGIS